MRLVATFSLLLLGGCGGATAIVVDVDLGGLQVPAEIDTLHFQLVRQPDYVAERSYDLTAGEREASLTIEQGPHTPDRVTIQVFADRAGVPVGSTAAAAARFEPGEIGHLSLVVER